MARPLSRRKGAAFRIVNKGDAKRRTVPGNPEVVVMSDGVASASRATRGGRDCRKSRCPAPWARKTWTPRRGLSPQEMALSFFCSSGSPSASHDGGVAKRGSGNRGKAPPLSEAGVEAPGTLPFFFTRGNMVVEGRCFECRHRRCLPSPHPLSNLALFSATVTAS